MMAAPRDGSDKKAGPGGQTLTDQTSPPDLPTMLRAESMRQRGDGQYGGDVMTMAADEIERLHSLEKRAFAVVRAIAGTDPYEVCLEPRDNDQACGGCPGCLLLEEALRHG